MIQHTMLLCQHVAQHGPEQWEQLPFCPAALSALKWHAIRMRSVPKASKAYSDWELCVLFAVGG